MDTLAKRGQLEEAFGCVLSEIESFLDVGRLMPPNRLRWSKVLGRPLLHKLYRQDSPPGRPYERAYVDYGDLVGAVMIEEVIDLDCMIFGRLPTEYGIDKVVRRTSELRPSEVEEMFDVHIIDPAWSDDEFAATWHAKYGTEWPCVGEGRIHHGLCKLHGKYTGFKLEWSLRSQKRESAFWAWFFQMRSTSSTG